jgi:hypothetical protein
MTNSIQQTDCEIIELADEALDFVAAAAGTCIDPNGYPNS